MNKTTVINHLFNYAMIPQEYREDKEVCLALIKKKPQEFPYLPEKLRANLDIALEAIKNKHENIVHIPTELKNTPLFLENALKINPHIIQYSKMKDNREAMLKILQTNGYLVQYYPDNDDYDIGLVAVQQEGLALEYLSEGLKNHDTIVHAALNNNAEALKYANPRFQNDPETVLMCCRQKFYSFEIASPSIKSNREVALKAVAI